MSNLSPRAVCAWVFLVPVVLLFGCATRLTYSSAVNSFAAPESSLRKAFFILPGAKGVEAKDLEFQEYASLTARVLERQGFTRAANISDANVCVFLSYSVGEPKEHSYSYALPVFGETGVASSQTYGTVTGTGVRTATYNSTTYNTPSYGITGYMPVSGSYTTFTRILDLDAVDLVYYRAMHEIRPLWHTRVASTGSSGDLRSIIPVLLVAAEPYIATSTGRIVDVNIADNDPRLAVLRAPATVIR